MYGKIGDTVSASITGAAALGTFIRPDVFVLQGMAGLGSMTKWAILAAVCSAGFYLGLLFNSTCLRSMARFLSGCVWGAVILLCLYARDPALLLFSAVALFMFDFYVVWRERAWLKKNRICSAVN